MSKTNTGLQPQTGRKEAAKVKPLWILRDAAGKIIKAAEPESVAYEPIINEEGQTEREWRSDLARREREEMFIGMTEFVEDGLGFVVSGGLQVVVFVVKIPWWILCALCQPPKRRFGDTYDNPPVVSRPKVNVNVEVNGRADVNVNVKINVK